MMGGIYLRFPLSVNSLTIEFCLRIIILLNRISCSHFFSKLAVLEILNHSQEKVFTGVNFSKVMKAAILLKNDFTKDTFQKVPKIFRMLSWKKLLGNV